MKGISIDNLLSQRDLRRFEVGGRTRFAAVDVLAILTDSQRPAELWHDLKVREPSLARWVETLDDGLEVVDLDGLLRLVQAVPSANAERVKWWLAESGRRRIEETEHPELSALRTRRIYERRGYPRRWIEKRVRGVSSRHELTAEWYKRGVRNSEEFRVLTNTLMLSAFGMDVRNYRRSKGLAGPGPTLRDSMSDMELTLTALAETTAAALSRARNSQGMQQLARDAKDAGEIAAQTLAEMERRIGQTIQSPADSAGSPSPLTAA